MNFTTKGELGNSHSVDSVMEDCMMSLLAGTKTYGFPDSATSTKSTHRNNKSVHEGKESIAGNDGERARKMSFNSPMKSADGGEKEPCVSHFPSDAELFDDYARLRKRTSKTLYYGGRLPSSSRPSLPLTVLAVNAFTSGTSGTDLPTLEFLDLDMASEIGRHACVSPTVVIMALIYLERLRNCNPGYLKTVKPSELFVVSLLVASKYIQDDGEEFGCFCEDWGKSAGFDKDRLQKLEIMFLIAIDWKLNVDVTEFNGTLLRVEQTLSRVAAGNRDWMTYTEMDMISSETLVELWSILKTYTIQVVFIASITYAALLSTVFASTILTSHILKFNADELLAKHLNSDHYLFSPTIQSNIDLGGNFQNESLPNTCYAPLFGNFQKTFDGSVASNRNTSRKLDMKLDVTPLESINYTSVMEDRRGHEVPVLSRSEFKSSMKIPITSRDSSFKYTSFKVT